jgi:flavodoxin long chain
MTTGLFYASTNGEVEDAADKIKAQLGPSLSVAKNISECEPADLQACDNLILGISTWDIGQLQQDWEAWWPKMDQLNLQGKKAAIFGMGDQVNYPDSYQDAVGMLADKLRERGATLVGFTDPAGHEFTATKVMKDGKMQGLCLDMLNQDELTAGRIAAWVPQIKSEMGLS